MSAVDLRPPAPGVRAMTVMAAPRTLTPILTDTADRAEDANRNHG